MADAARAAHEALEVNRKHAIRFVQASGIDETKEILRSAHEELQRRLQRAEAIGGPGGQSFTAARLRASLAQVQQVTRDVVGESKKAILRGGKRAADQGAAGTAKYLVDVDRNFRGAGVQPLAIREALMFQRAHMGVHSSLLNRLASEAGNEKAKSGILARYGAQTVGVFEKILRDGLLTGKTNAEMAEELRKASPFLKGQPAWWAERIVRTELAGAYARAQWESIREADDQLGDMVKILCATFDDRTGADSYAVHGQIRRPDEAFESWYGFYQHPPNRPNDREIVVPHRISWPRMKHLDWRTEEQILNRWQELGNKDGVPPRPNMTTVEVEKFGTEQPVRPVAKTEKKKAETAKVVAAKTEKKKAETAKVVAAKTEPVAKSEPVKTAVKAAPVRPVDKPSVVFATPVTSHEGPAVKKVVPVVSVSSPIEIGKHVGSVDVEGITQKQSAEILQSALGHPDVLNFLERHPLKQVKFLREFERPYEGSYGLYNKKNDVISIRTSVESKDFGRTWDEEKGIWSVSVTAGTAKERLATTLTHEFGHHVHLVGYGEGGTAEDEFRRVDRIVKKAFKNGKAITRYGATNDREYFAESYAAYRLHPERLKRKDPEGFRMVEAVLRERGILKQEVGGGKRRRTGLD